MITIISGAKGSGKTKKIIDKANSSIPTTDGHIVFLTDTKRYSLEIKYQIRLIDTKEYGITNKDLFMGFVKGIVSGNGDLQQVYIDGMARITQLDISEMEYIYDELEKMSNANNVEFIVTVSSDTLPEFMKKYAC